jgi:membrane protease YdiL (CAAX protease family)
MKTVLEEKITDTLDKNPNIISRRSILHYVGGLFLCSWGLQIIAIVVTTGLDDPNMKWWLAATMLTPAMVTFFFLHINTALKSKLCWKPNVKVVGAVFLSVLVPIVFALVVVLIFESLHWGTSQWFVFSSNEVIISHGPFLLGLGNQSWLIFAANLFITGFFFAFVNGFVAAGEEIAWRGFLQGVLVERLGVWKGILLLGFLWSMWHLPIQLYGYNYPENPFTGSFIISPLILIGYSFFMGWLTVYSKSFIPAAIAHGAGNGIQEGIISQIELTTPELNMYLIRLLTSVTIGLIFLYFWSRSGLEGK